MIYGLEGMGLILGRKLVLSSMDGDFNYGGRILGILQRLMREPRKFYRDNQNHPTPTPNPPPPSPR